MSIRSPKDDATSWKMRCRTLASRTIRGPSIGCHTIVVVSIQNLCCVTCRGINSRTQNASRGTNHQVNSMEDAMLRCFVVTVTFIVSSACFAQDPVQVGDQVEVVRPTKLMAGENTLGTFPKGKKFRVERISGTWLLTTTPINGKQSGVWVKSNDVRKFHAPRVSYSSGITV